MTWWGDLEAGRDDGMAEILVTCFFHDGGNGMGWREMRIFFVGGRFFWLRAPMFLKKNMGVSEGLWKNGWLLMVLKCYTFF